jgi:peptidoglycan/LPS O-acetylase OafA/YrhL
MQYRKEIDGLRALAILPVIFFHAGSSLFSGGYVGVDVFFVISGFLISSIIISKLEAGDFSFLEFFEKRVRRILPPLFVILIISIPLSWVSMNPTQLDSFYKSLVSVSTFTSNMLFAKEGNYFSAELEARPLLHTWSLGIEEQFYFVFPFLVFIAFQLRKKLFLFFIIVFIGSLVLSIRTSQQNPESAFYLLPTRAWELVLGALCSLAPIEKLRKSSSAEALAILGIGLIIYATTAFDSSTPFPSYFALVPTLGTCLVILFTQPSSAPGKLLCSPPLVWVGLLSYGLYLWHQPLFTFVHLLKSEVTKMEIGGVLLLVLILSFLSQKFIETPFRKGKINRSKVFAFAILGNLFFLALGWGLLKLKPQPYRLRGLDLAGSEYGGADYQWVNLERRLPKSFVLYGDSHAKQYFRGFQEISSLLNKNMLTLTHSACLSLPGLTNIYKGKIHPSCIELLSKLKTAVKHDDSTVVISYRWSKLLHEISSKKSIDGKKLNEATKKEFANLITKSLEALFGELGNNRKYIIFGNVPSANLERGYLNCLIAKDSKSCPSKFKLEYGELNFLRKYFKRLETQYPNVTFIDPYQALCDQKYCYVVDANKIIYSDHAHLSVIGAKKVLETFREKLVQSL